MFFFWFFPAAFVNGDEAEADAAGALAWRQCRGCAACAWLPWHFVGASYGTWCGWNVSMVRGVLRLGSGEWKCVGRGACVGEEWSLRGLLCFKNLQTVVGFVANEQPCS